MVVTDKGRPASFSACRVRPLAAQRPSTSRLLRSFYISIFILYTTLRFGRNSTSCSTTPDLAPRVTCTGHDLSMALPTRGRVIINTTAGELDIELWSRVRSQPCH